MIYGAGGGGNYLAVLQINCQYTTPGTWKYGEPNFEIKHPVSGAIVAKNVPCGGQLRDLELTTMYTVLGYEGTKLWYSSAFNPGNVVIIQMP